MKSPVDGMVLVSRSAIDALDAALDLAADVLMGDTEASREDLYELGVEICKCRGMILEAGDQ